MYIFQILEIHPSVICFQAFDMSSATLELHPGLNLLQTLVQVSGPKMKRLFIEDFLQRGLDIVQTNQFREVLNVSSYSTTKLQIVTCVWRYYLLNYTCSDKYYWNNVTAFYINFFPI